MIPFWKKTGKHSKPQSAQKRRQNAKPAVPRTAQQSIPMQRMFEDGTCRVKPNYYTRTIQYQDISYQLAQQEDKTAIFEEWCSFLNFFDSSIKFELSFVNMATDSTEFEKSIRIPFQKDGFDDVRAEYSQMLRQQLAKGNNGLTKTKFITFGVEGESMAQVKPRLDHIQNDLLNNFHRLGVQAKPLNGVQRLKLMHDMPILEDLYNALLQQDEKEAHHVATALEIYVKGSLNLFNHRTNVNVNNRIVCYDIKELGKQMKKLGMLIVQDQVWGRVTANRSSGKSTRYYMDEMHLLLKEEQTAAYSVEIWKRFRKWGGIPTGLTQNVKDLLSSREVENIFENSDMIIMLNQAAGDRQILAKQLNISPHQLSYVTHSGEGEGLLFFGNVILPFVDRFPTDLELYRIMTTKLGEVSEGAQK